VEELPRCREKCKRAKRVIPDAMIEAKIDLVKANQFTVGPLYWAVTELVMQVLDHHLGKIIMAINCNTEEVDCVSEKMDCFIQE
ncbi:hypothetical protein V8B97DRAFT_1852330, partial [Scleroderma yunnanense]